MPAPKDPAAYALWKERMSKARKGEKNGMFGKKHTEKAKQRISEKMTGKMSGENNPMFGVHLTGERNPMFGKHMPEETKRKLSEAMSGRTSWNKGLPSIWTKGIPRSEETKAKISKNTTGKPKTKMSIEKLRATKLVTTPTGKDSIHWKGGITKLNLHIRTLPRYKNVCSDMMKEVDYTDAFTGKRGGMLACHHIVPQNIIIRIYDIKTIDDARECPLLFDKHNMVVMLSSAHDKFHNLYGDNKNIYELTPDQIKELYL